MPINPSERQEQEVVIEWMRWAHPWLIDHTIYIMNERKCSAHVGAMLKRQGRLKGASDLFVAWPCNVYHGLFIEMKSKTGRPTAEQLEFLKRMDRVGYKTALAYGADEGINTIKQYLALG